MWITHVAATAHEQAQNQATSHMNPITGKFYYKLEVMNVFEKGWK